MPLVNICKLLYFFRSPFSHVYCCGILYLFPFFAKRECRRRIRFSVPLYENQRELERIQILENFMKDEGSTVCAFSHIVIKYHCSS